MNLKQTAVLLIVGLLIVPAPALGVVRGSPDISVSAPGHTFTPGQDASLDLQLTNSGDLDKGSARNPALNQEVTTARGVDVTVESNGAPVEIDTGTQTIGSLPQGGSAPLGYAISVDEDAEPGTYTLEVDVEYTHTSVIGELNGARSTQDVSRTFEVEIEIEDSARFRVVGTESDVRVGTSGTVSVTMRNVGSEAARDATVQLQSLNSDLVFGSSASASRYVGEWAAGETRTIEYQVRATPTAEQQQYAFQAVASYEDENGAPKQSEALSLGIVPTPEQRFEIVETESTTAVGETGTLSVTIRNAGAITVNDATVQLQSGSSALVFGSAASATRFVGEWAPGETRTVEYDLTVTDTAETRSYALTAQVTYEDPGDDPGTSRSLALGVVPEPEREFSLSNVESSLRVGTDGTISGTITNDGDAPARDVVVSLVTSGQNLDPAEREYSVGTLAGGESADFEFSIEVSEGAAAGPKQFTFRAEYRNEEGQQRASDDLLTRQEIAAQEPTFGVEVVNRSVESGSTGSIQVRVTNNGDETLTAITSKLYADDPISAEDDEAFIERLEPGQSTTVTYTVSTSGAIAKTYPLSTDFQYDDSDGDTLVSDTYRVPVDVTAAERGGGGGGGGLPLFAGIAVVVVVVAIVGGYVRFYR